MKKLNTRFLAGLFVLALLQFDFAQAHVQTGSLGVAASATDFYQVSCPSDSSGTPSMLQAQILSGNQTANAPTSATVTQLSVQVSKTASLSAINSTDQISNDANYSPLVSLSGGAGDYYVTVNKNQATANSKVYTLQFHCKASNGDHTTTELSVLQNQ